MLLFRPVSGHEKGPAEWSGPGYVSGMPGNLVIIGLLGGVFLLAAAVLAGVGASTPETGDPETPKGKRVLEQRGIYRMAGYATGIVGSALALWALVGALL